MKHDSYSIISIESYVLVQLFIFFNEHIIMVTLYDFLIADHFKCLKIFSVS